MGPTIIRRVIPYSCPTRDMTANRYETTQAHAARSGRDGLWRRVVSGNWRLPQSPVITASRTFAVLPECADCVDKVGIQTGWDSDEACAVEVTTGVKCILRAFSGSFGHLRPW